MNRDCHGDFYTLGRERFYRCFADGTVIKASIVGAVCPQCKRAVCGNERGAATVQRRLVTEVLLEDLGWIVHSEEAK